MSDGVEAGGFGGFLTTAKLNIVEFGILCAFWAGVAFVSQFISLAMILEFPPIAAVISVLAFVWGYTPMTSAVVGAAGCAYVLFKYRATFVKALMFMVKKVTRPFTR